MASSLASTSTSPTVSTSMDLHETDVFSDDSGVDVKPQIKKPQEKLLKISIDSHDMLIESNRRNKRKSSEPKKRKDVLLMKRFRWDTDDEDIDGDNKLEDDDIDDVFDRERPSSSDSGFQLCPPSTSLDLSTKKPLEFSSEHIPASLDLSTRKTTPSESKKKQKQWRKPKAVKTSAEIKKEPLPAFRQSVIRKHEPCSSSHLDTTKEPSLRCDGESLLPIVTSHPHPQSSTTPDVATSHEYGLELLDGQDSSSPGRSPGRSVGRPRNYKSMSRQRRIEANARERTRVHTISAAFENLRRAVPAYAHNQKLSKLAILRIASAYIVALACLNDQDYSQDQTEPALSDCVDACTRTIQAEGRSRRRSAKD